MQFEIAEASASLQRSNCSPLAMLLRERVSAREAVSSLATTSAFHVVACEVMTREVIARGAIAREVIARGAIAREVIARGAIAREDASGGSRRRMGDGE